MKKSDIIGLLGGFASLIGIALGIWQGHEIDKETEETTERVKDEIQKKITESFDENTRRLKEDLESV